MGTFHNDKGELHGITVVVDTPSSRVFVGRCDTVTDQGVVLLDGAMHDADQPGPNGEEPVSKAAYLAKAAKFGVWKAFDHHVVPTADVATIVRLGEWATT